MFRSGVARAEHGATERAAHAGIRCGTDQETAQGEQGYGRNVGEGDREQEKRMIALTEPGVRICQS